jgi:hypothetical protein
MDLSFESIFESLLRPIVPLSAQKFMSRITGCGSQF